MSEQDKRKDNWILLVSANEIELPSGEVIEMAENSAELLNAVYKEISEKLGIEIALEVYQLFKGQQICFPVRFFDPAVIQQKIIEEYDGTNLRQLAVKYDYSEKTIRRIIRENINKDGE